MMNFKFYTLLGLVCLGKGLFAGCEVTGTTASSLCEGKSNCEIAEGVVTEDKKFICSNTKLILCEKKNSENIVGEYRCGRQYETWVDRNLNEKIMANDRADKAKKACDEAINAHTKYDSGLFGWKPSFQKCSAEAENLKNQADVAQDFNQKMELYEKCFTTGYSSNYDAKKGKRENCTNSLDVDHHDNPRKKRIKKTVDHQYQIYDLKTQKFNDVIIDFTPLSTNSQKQGE